MYADAGFEDILYGFPFIPSHLERVAKLTSRLEMFHTMVTSREMCQYLANNNPPEGKSWSVFLKVDIALSLSLPLSTKCNLYQIDCGNGRAGVQWNSQEAVDIVRFIRDKCPNILFQVKYSLSLC